MKRICVFFLLVFICAILSAQDRIAVVDMDYLFNEYHKKKIADIELKKQAEIYTKYADDLASSLEKLQQEFRKLRDDSLNIALSVVERENRRLAAQNKYRQMKEKEEELRSYGLDRQNLMRAQHEEIREKLVSEVKAVVAKIAEANGYGLVLDKSGKTLNQISSVVYASSSSDITDLVLKELNPDLSGQTIKEEKKKEAGE